MRRKNQVTIPASIVEKAHLPENCKFDVDYINGVIIFTPRSVIKQIARGKEFFMRENFLQFLPHDSCAFDTAAKLRAETGMKLIDALHCATALKAGCQFFITNDTGIHSSASLEVISIKVFIA